MDEVVRRPGAIFTAEELLARPYRDVLEMTCVRLIVPKRREIAERASYREQSSVARLQCIKTFKKLCIYNPFALNRSSFQLLELYKAGLNSGLKTPTIGLRW